MNTAIIIPARFGSTRFPGKPLALIKGKSLLYRTWALAKAVQRVNAVYIATDDVRIEAHAKAFGAQVIMTSNKHENGTERVFEAARLCAAPPDIILNLQGDAVLTPPWIIQALLDEILANPTVELATPATKISLEQYNKMASSKAAGIVGGTMVVFDQQYNALYFSKSMIPFMREKNLPELPFYKHIGLYAYRFATLRKYLSLAPTLLEQMEGLEQLRALENGIKIKVVVVDSQGRTSWSIDSPEDIEIVEKIIFEQGELI